MSSNITMSPNVKRFSTAVFLALLGLLLFISSTHLFNTHYPLSERRQYQHWQKLGIDGQPVSNTSGPWKCALDKESGLIWENKDRFEGASHNSWTYTRHSQRRHSQSREIEGSCSGLQRCHAIELVKLANTEKWCGVDNWRVPTLTELQGLLDFSYPAPGPLICPCFLPHTKRSSYWTNTLQDNKYLGVNFHSGEVKHFPEHAALYLRLVSGPHFETD